MRLRSDSTAAITTPATAFASKSSQVLSAKCTCRYGALGRHRWKHVSGGKDRCGPWRTSNGEMLVSKSHGSQDRTALARQYPESLSKRRRACGQPGSNRLTRPLEGSVAVRRRRDFVLDAGRSPVQLRAYGPSLCRQVVHAWILPVPRVLENPRRSRRLPRFELRRHDANR